MGNPLSGLPEQYFPFAAKATAGTTLNAFDLALKEAGISDYNLLKVSSIIPAGAREAIPDLPKGSLLAVAFGFLTSEEEGRFISAAVALGLPKERGGVGVIMEFAGYRGLEEAEQIAQGMARDALMQRGLGVKEIKVYSAGMEVKGPSCVMAGVALW